MSILEAIKFQVKPLQSIIT